MKTPSNLAALLAVVVACPIAAQEAPSGAAADLAAMRAKADADPDLSRQFQQIESESSVGRGQVDPSQRTAEFVRRLVFRNVAVRFGLGRVANLEEPVRIATLERLEPARARAQAASQVLAADLDGDWQITRDEILETAKYHRIDGAAQAFVTADADRNDMLSFEEIKVAVSEMVAITVGRGAMAPSLMPVFDFDDDGYLTQAELDRGVQALINP